MALCGASEAGLSLVAPGVASFEHLVNWELRAPLLDGGRGLNSGGGGGGGVRGAEQSRLPEGKVPGLRQECLRVFQRLLALRA